MRNLLIILFICLLQNSFAQTPTSNAGADQTIYLTSTSQITLTGTATNRNTSQWTEISTDYMSGATITSQSSLTTTVTGLPQGVFYFELAVTSSTSAVAKDTVMISVDYAGAPATSTLLRSIAPKYPIMADTVNARYDTTNTLSQSTPSVTFPDGTGTVYYDRSRSNGEFIDKQRGKFYSIIEDGYKWFTNNYARSEMHFGSGYSFDTSKIYVIEWKGYFPQNFSYLQSNSNVTALLQIHGNDGAVPPFEFVLNNNNLRVFESSDGGNGSDNNVVVYSLSNMVNTSHTVRVQLKEGLTGTGFVKVFIDGNIVYKRDTGRVGSTLMQDYPKFATVYDFGRYIVNPDSLARGRKFSLVTENYNLYRITDTSTLVAAPTVNAGNNQTITLPTNSATLTAAYTTAPGYTATFNWVKESGGSCTITSPTSYTTPITGLSAGSYRFGCTLTQSDGQTSYDYVLVTVNSASGITNNIVTHGKETYKNK